MMNKGKDKCVMLVLGRKRNNVGEYGTGTCKVLINYHIFCREMCEVADDAYLSLPGGCHMGVK